MFQYLITIQPLGFLYASAGGFLSAENLVGKSRTKFPPDAATVSGMLLSHNRDQQLTDPVLLKKNLFVAGPFWAKNKNTQNFYVPIPWSKIISKTGVDEWQYKQGEWHRKNLDIEPDYAWISINAWNQTAKIIKDNKSMAEVPWKYVSMLHPRMKKEERHVTEEDGLFLENAVQMDDEYCLVYLSSESLPDGWYRFGGENHIVGVKSISIPQNSQIIKLLQQPIKQSFALITPAVWGSSRLSYRYPQVAEFEGVQMLTDRAIPYRFRLGDGDNRSGRLGRGRYAVSSGSVYVLSKPLNKSWWDWPEDWFPNEGYSLKQVGCSLCLPLDVS